MELVNIVQENMEGFTRQNIPGVNMSSSTMDKLGNPSEADYNGMLRSDMISHFPVTPDYIDATNKIFSRNIPYLKGKKFRRQPLPVV